MFVAFCKRKRSDLWLSGFKIFVSVAVFVNSYLQEKWSIWIVFYGQELFLQDLSHLNCPKTDF